MNLLESKFKQGARIRSTILLLFMLLAILFIITLVLLILSGLNLLNVMFIVCFSGMFILSLVLFYYLLNRIKVTEQKIINHIDEKCGKSPKENNEKTKQ